jgi:hypothetical protein
VKYGEWKWKIDRELWKPIWQMTGKVLQGGVELSGDFMYEAHWQVVRYVTEEIHRDGDYVRFHNVNSDGKADKCFTPFYSSWNCARSSLLLSSFLDLS